MWNVLECGGSGRGKRGKKEKKKNKVGTCVEEKKREGKKKGNTDEKKNKIREK